MPFVSDEIVTAAKLNMAVQMQAVDHNGGNRTFTNTTYADLDALTGGAGTLNALAVTVTTGTSVKITLGALLNNDTIASSVFMSYRVSGATTLAADDTRAARLNAPTAAFIPWVTFVEVRTGLTAGSNTFELQARASANTGRINSPLLIVETIV